MNFLVKEVKFHIILYNVSHTYIFILSLPHNLHTHNPSTSHIQHINNSSTTITQTTHKLPIACQQPAHTPHTTHTTHLPYITHTHPRNTHTLPTHTETHTTLTQPTQHTHSEIYMLYFHK
uniref:Uncharacterized protein n=1 Tax=Arion vulgaris TaxID=1028688 RepID=A0A0B6ZLJ2_9EUPU